MRSAPTVGIVDYQLGNLFSVEQACMAVGLQPILIADPKELRGCHGAILPGVGAFGDAMRNLRLTGLDLAVHEFVSRGRPLMGVCLGMQLLLGGSEEFGNTVGLGLIDGRVVRFPVQAQSASGRRLKVPQIGWNQVSVSEGLACSPSWAGTPLENTENGEFFYFVHSFYAAAVARKNTLSVTRYGDVEYCSSLVADKVVAFQFHPEKSGPRGIEIYRTWKQQNFG